MKLKDLKNLDKNDILEMLGVETGVSTASVLWWVGLVVVSAVAGGTAVLLLAPKSGRELRDTIGRRAREAADDILTTARAKVSEAGADRD